MGRRRRGREDRDIDPDEFDESDRSSWNLFRYMIYPELAKKPIARERSSAPLSTLADYKIRIGQEYEWNVHKDVLIAKSEFFRAMLSSTKFIVRNCHDLTCIDGLQTTPGIDRRGCNSI